MATPKVTAFESTGADGLPMRGNVHSAASGGERRPTVVVCHGFKGFKDWGFFPYVADRLAAAGFTAVRFNFSGAGVSDGDAFDEPERFGHDTYSNAIDDLGAVLDWVGAERVGVFGHSKGGGTAILRAAVDERIATLVTLAAIDSTARWDEATLRRWRADGKLEITNARTGEVLPLYTDVLDDLDRYGETRLNVERAARQIGIPWLVIHGDLDEAVSVDAARHLAGWTGQGDRELLVVEGGAHTLGARHPWSGTTPQLEGALDASIRWFARHLL